ncbi:MAG: alanine racemase [Nanoarchaeota archaeon]|nr:alanine racemase [Nanoarchaeota archaeon]
MKYKQGTILRAGLEKKITTEVQKLLKTEKGGLRGRLLEPIKNAWEKKRQFEKLAKQHGTPCYVFDEKALREAAQAYKNAFLRYIPNMKFYYAMKTNPYPSIMREVIRQGFGVDVSSAEELKDALGYGAKECVYSGPGKTEKDLAFALQHEKKVIIHLDSFSELKRLNMLARKAKKTMRAGIRVYTSFHGEWKKFGIDVKNLSKFWNEAKHFPNVRLEGIQFHLSWQKNSESYAGIIKELAEHIKKLSRKERGEIAFIDIGGGFLPHMREGYYPWQTPLGSIAEQTLKKKRKEIFRDSYLITESVPPEEYAKGIAKAIRKHLDPLVSCTYISEPGRIISTYGMHILLRVADVKTRENVIMDGGMNMIGWERFSYEYFPVLNLTHPSKKEIPCVMYGRLCLSDEMDHWGYTCYASKMEEGDLVVVPNQGHLTYALAQNFIHPIPPVYKLPE